MYLLRFCVYYELNCDLEMEEMSELKKIYNVLPLWAHNSYSDDVYELFSIALLERNTHLMLFFLLKKKLIKFPQSTFVDVVT